MFAITALTEYPLLGVAGGGVGALTALWIASRDGGRLEQRGHHAHLTLGGVCTHRIFEGLVLGTLYTAGAPVGMVGVAVVAGHTVFETAAIGGLYPLSRVQAFAAICLVQIGYAVGAVAGVTVSLSGPVSVHSTTLGVTAGVLLIVGVAELRCSSITVRFGGVTE